MFSGKKHYQFDEKTKKRRKASRKVKRLFEFKNDGTNHIVFTSKDHKALDTYSKLKDYTSTMIEKVLVKEEVVANPKAKQDIMFFKILNGMQGRFKQ